MSVNSVNALSNLSANTACKITEQDATLQLKLNQRVQNLSSLALLSTSNFLWPNTETLPNALLSISKKACSSVDAYFFFPTQAQKKLEQSRNYTKSAGLLANLPDFHLLHNHFRNMNPQIQRACSFFCDFRAYWWRVCWVFQVCDFYSQSCSTSPFPPTF